MASHQEIVTNFPIRIEIRVRFADIDILGHLNNAKFFTYMEEARIAYLEKIPEFNFIGRTEFKVGIVLASISCDFLAPARMGQTIIVAAGVTKIGQKSLTLDYQMVEKQSGKMIGKGSSAVVIFDYERNVSAEVPASMRQRILEIEKVKA